jgi:hypothetical protein
MQQHAKLVEVYERDNKSIQGQLVKFKDYLKVEMSKKMWIHLESNFEHYPDDEKETMETRIVAMVQDCTEEFYQSFQRSLLSPPLTPRSTDHSKELYDPTLRTTAGDSPEYQFIPVNSSSKELLTTSKSTVVDEVPDANLETSLHDSESWSNVGTQLSLVAPPVQNSTAYLFGDELTFSQNDVVEQDPFDIGTTSRQSGFGREEISGSQRDSLFLNCPMSPALRDDFGSCGESNNVDYDAIFSSLWTADFGPSNFDTQFS